MKKKTMLSTLLAATMWASIANAETHRLYNDVKLVKRDAKKMEIRVNQPNGGLIDVELTDGQGTTVYQGVVKSGENIVKLFDLNALPNGEYTLKCHNEVFCSTQRFYIHNGGIEVPENSYQETKAPKLKTYGVNRFLVETNGNTSAHVVITNFAGEIMYEGTFNGALQVFNLNHLVGGEYRFDFSVGNATFSRYATVK